MTTLQNLTESKKSVDDITPGEKDRAKRTSVQRWVDAVNYHGGFGEWTIVQCRDPNKVMRTLEKLL